MAKDKILQIRVSEDYHEKLKRLAIEKGVSVSLLVRNAVEYIPGTATEEEIKKGLDYLKACDSSAMLFALKNTTDVIKNQYNQELNWEVPADKTLIDMHDKDIFNSLKKIALKSILNNFECDKNYKLDKETEMILKELMVKYISNK